MVSFGVFVLPWLNLDVLNPFSSHAGILSSFRERIINSVKLTLIKCVHGSVGNLFSPHCNIASTCFLIRECSEVI